MGVLKKIFGNARKPQGVIGKMMAKGMNRGPHEKLANWGFTHLMLNGDETAIDLGCGGGANVAKLLTKLPNGKVSGLDYSEVSVETSKETNRREISAGRCNILQGNVMNLPLKEQSFDVVTAFETIYFWPDLSQSFSEVYRILKQGGRFMITNESDGKHEASLKWKDLVDGMNVYTAEELETLLTGVGFTIGTIDEDSAHDRLCVVACKA
ncbi:MAG: class I SAM-dependent methyltransferase [Lachnospiraceae bacterium]|nr:class I SAM-dependent methyltransferase [Lachnospiraceae bacterium]